MARQESELDDCGCCEGMRPPEPVRNAPGLPALRYRVGTHAQFVERMLATLPVARVDPGSANAKQPLAGFAARTSDDPTVALIDACATVSDILTFYQERIANEGYLRTATERRSVLELARAIGYELAPGVAASVHLSFTVEDAPGAPGVTVLAKGTQVQSVPPQGKPPQVFETSAEITARAEWNALRPRLTRAADLAILVDATGSPPSGRLVLLGASGGFPVGTPDLLANVAPQHIHRLDVRQSGTAPLDAVEVRRVYFTESAGLAKGGLVLFTGKRNDAVATLAMRAAEVVPEPERKRIRVDLEPLPRATEPAPAAPSVTLIPYGFAPSWTFAQVRLDAIPFNRSNVVGTVLSQTWRERDLHALIDIQGWRGASVSRAVNAKPAATEPLALEAGAFVFREKLGFFGNTAPKWKSLPRPSPQFPADPYPEGWDEGDTVDAVKGSVNVLPRQIWTDSQGTNNHAAGPHAYLERPVAGLTRAGWIVLDSPELEPEAFSLHDARETSRADYGLSGRTMALSLGNKKGEKLSDLPTQPFTVRATTAHVGSQRLALAELPIELPVARGTTAIELDRMVLGLAVGQPVALAGESADLPGVDAAEIAFLSDIVHSGGRTTLVLSDGLAHAYARDKLVINANVVHATHGETVHELLGGGNAAVGNQKFALKKPPLTYVSAPTAGGIASSLEVRVNGVRWDEVPSLYGVEAARKAYAVRIGDDAVAQVIFGDGLSGARLPTGAANVAAAYRSGIGPDGEVEAGSLTLPRAMPLGLRGVTNALAASGAEGPERLADARRNAPRTVVTFERIVSLSDYEDYARTFPGIGKARGDLLWVSGGPQLHLTIAGATGGAPSDDTLRHLATAIRDHGDPAQRFSVSGFFLRYFTLEARVVVDERHDAGAVLAAIEAHLRAAFAFEQRDFGQSVTAAEVIKLVHEVDGVIAVDLERLAPYGEDAAPPLVAPHPIALAARPARWNGASRRVEPAELLLINPVGIRLEEA